MADPISSRVDDYARSRNLTGYEDLTCHEDPGLATPNPSHPLSSGSIGGASPSRSEPGVRGPTVEAHAVGGDLYAGAFALRGRDASGVDVEVFSASVHVGQRESAAQVGMARMGGSMFGGQVEVAGEVFTVQTHATFDNPDGSTGLGASAGATIVGGEVTFHHEADSVIFAASAGTTIGASGGIRDIDRDGQPEYCGRLDFGLGSLGVCIEKRW